MVTDGHPYTHTGYRSQVGGDRFAGYSGHRSRIVRPGATHALVAGPDPMRYTALCGERVTPRSGEDDWGYPVRPNVRPIADPDALPVTCRRCRRSID